MVINKQGDIDRVFDSIDDSNLLQEFFNTEIPKPWKDNTYVVFYSLSEVKNRGKRNKHFGLIGETSWLSASVKALSDVFDNFHIPNMGI